VSPKPRPGMLIACDGTRAPDLREAVLRLQRELRRQGLAGAASRWDASGLFEELQVSKRRHRRLSPRALLLLYAADLAFRVRWEIEPALKQGRIVIAAPYISTAVAFGAAVGLPRRWVETVLRFAPAPALSVCAGERKKSSGWTGKPLSGFGEFSAATLDAGNPDLDAHAYRRPMTDALDALVHRRRAARVDRRLIRRIVP
jgi:hypothetical protein